VTPVSLRKRFSLKEARDLLPEVRRITEPAARSLEVIAGRIESMEEGDPQRVLLEQEYSGRLNEWVEAVIRLGCEVKGVFLVDFDNGEGYYCWKWPETDVDHFHGYEEGFAGRLRIN
jgi:hypothetical protein